MNAKFLARDAMAGWGIGVSGGEFGFKFSRFIGIVVSRPGFRRRRRPRALRIERHS